MTHLYKIKDKQGKLVTFKPTETQLRHLAERGNHRYNRILKYRQGGFTTLYCIDYLDDALWTPGYAAAIIAHERETLDKIFLIIKRAYEGLPESIKPTTKQDTLRSYRFEKSFDGEPLDSEIYVALKLRGGTVQALHISERAFITGERGQELEAGSKQSVPLTGRISEETTANGYNDFYDSFMKDWERGKGQAMDYRSYFYAWHEHSEYRLPGEILEYTPADQALQEIVRVSYNKELTDGQLLWYRWKLSQIATSSVLAGLRPEQLMRQEYPSTVFEAFQSGLGNVFDLSLLETTRPNTPLRTLDNGTKVWAEPDPQKHYVTGADPSGGDSSDQTVIDVWCVEDKEQVAQWAGMVRPDDAAEINRDLAVLYNNAYAGVENNMLSMILFLSKIYDNYYSTVVVDEKYDRRTKKVGWNTNNKTRDIMIDEFLMRFEEKGIIINSSLTLSEMRTFVKKENGKREHADGKQDDALFAGMIAVQMFKYEEKHRLRGRVFAQKPGGL